MTFEALELLLALISIAMGIYQLQKQGNGKAARFFFSLGVLVLGIFAWSNVHQQPTASVSTNTVSTTTAPGTNQVTNQPNTNQTPSGIPVGQNGNSQESSVNNSRLRELEKEMAELQTRVANASQSQSNIRYTEMLPPSFNCAKAQTDSERLICGNPVLSDADGRLGRAYRGLLNFVTGENRTQIRDAQRMWIKWRDQQLSSVCTHEGRTDMNCAMNLWEQRIQQLDQALNAVSSRAVNVSSVP